MRSLHKSSYNFDPVPGRYCFPPTDHGWPMMTGTGQFGAVRLGGMISLLMVREGLASNDYKNSGRYKHPPGTVADRIDNPTMTRVCGNPMFP